MLCRRTLVNATMQAGFIMYFSLSMVFMVGFIQRTLKVARSQGKRRQSAEHVNGNGNDERLVNVAVRILVCVALSVFTTLFTILIHMLDDFLFIMHSC